MPIAYPILLPGLDLPNVGDTVPISSIRFRPRSVVALSASLFTLQQQVQVHQGQIWAAEIRLIPQRGGNAQEWIAALLSLNGIQGTFYLGDVTLRQPRGNPTGTPKVDGANQTGQTLDTKGWGANNEGVLLKGDWIQLGSGATQRIYRVLKDISSGADGKAAIDIWPRLRESPDDEEPLILENTMGVFCLTDNEMPWDIDRALLYGFEFTAMEALRYAG